MPLLIIVCLLSACTAQADEQEIALSFLDAFWAGNNDVAYAQLSEAVAAQLPRAQFDQIAPQLSMLGGAYEGMGEAERADVDGMAVFGVPVRFARMAFQATVTVDGDGHIAGFFVRAVDVGDQASIRLPEGVVEEDINFGEAWVLPGTLTRPDQTEGKLPAVVLVHGSGPNDRDETLGSAKPFRDLAYGLAEAGIVVLRYDKRTYTYGTALEAQGLDDFTVWDETVEDAILARQRLLELDYVDPERIVIIGHSMGAMLAPRIQAQGGGYAGMVLMAGSPRPLWEIQEAQNLAVIEGMPPADQAALLPMIEEERASALAVQAAEDPSAFEGLTVFGLPAYYVWEMLQYDAATLAQDAGIPILVLQGEEDAQIYADVDYVLWQEALAETPDVAYRLYTGLGHAFMTEDSAQVERQVIDDIIAFIQEL